MSPPLIPLTFNRYNLKLSSEKIFVFIYPSQNDLQLYTVQGLIYKSHFKRHFCQYVRESIWFWCYF
jgi:hypothetical protein